MFQLLDLETFDVSLRMFEKVLLNSNVTKTIRKIDFQKKKYYALFKSMYSIDYFKQYQIKNQTTIFLYLQKTVSE